MRPIDADALKMRFKVRGCFKKEMLGVMVAKIIDTAPTIAAVPSEVVKAIRWERDVAIEQLEEHGITFGCKAEDVVKVVRCKDCDNWCEEMKCGRADLGNEVAPCSEWSNQEDGHTRYTKPTDFCSYGERRDSDGEITNIL